MSAIVISKTWTHFVAFCIKQRIFFSHCSSNMWACVRFFFSLSSVGCYPTCCELKILSWIFITKFWCSQQKCARVENIHVCISIKIFWSFFLTVANGNWQLKLKWIKKMEWMHQTDIERVTKLEGNRHTILSITFEP